MANNNRELGNKTENRLVYLSPDQLAQRLRAEPAPLVLDVRDESEWKEGYIKEAQHLFVGYLKQQFKRVPQDRPLAIHCSWGGRASLAASILLSLGYVNVVLGAIRAWKSLGYPLESG